MRKPVGDSSMRHLPAPSGGEHWPRTPWSEIRKWRAGTTSDKKNATDRIVHLYYKPVYRFFQRVLNIHGEKLKDVTQDFFTRFIDKEFLKNIRHETSFRGFLKVACRRHYINWLEAHNKPQPVPLDAEEPLPIDPDKIDPMIDEELRKWYVDEAVEKVKETLLAQKKDVYFEVFKRRVIQEPPMEYEAISREVNKRVYDVRNYLTAARKIFRETLLELAAERSDDPKDELRELGLYKYVS